MNRKKLLITGLSLLLVAAVSVGATLAYFTDTSEAASNVFTMGHVSADVVDTTGNLDGEDSPGRRVVTGTLNDPDDPLSGLVYSDVLPGDVIDKTVGAVLYADSMEAWLAVKLEVTATPAEGSSLAAADVVAELLGLGQSLIAGAFALVMMTLPTVIRTTQESLKTVPLSYREGSLALGSGKWHMIRTVVLPSSVDGIVTGCILAVGRIVGESAVLMFTAGMGTRLARYGGTVGEFFTNLFDSSGATLTVALYNYAKERADFDSAFAVAVVLLAIAFAINIAAKLAGKKLKKR